MSLAHTILPETTAAMLRQFPITKSQTYRVLNSRMNSPFDILRKAKFSLILPFHKMLTVTTAQLHTAVIVAQQMK